MTLEEILQESPKLAFGSMEQTAAYSVACCWWTTFPRDCGRRGSFGLPCCPHCGSMLMQAPLADFVAAAREHPAHYGAGGLDTFVAAHSKNATTCHDSWNEY